MNLTVNRLRTSICVANGVGTMRRIVAAFSMKKGFGAGARQNLDRLVTVVHAALGTQDRAPSPFDVTAVMQVLESKDEPSDELDVGALARGIATLPANRLLPSLFADGERPKLALQKMLRALLGSSEAVSRGELVAVSSRNSVDRYLQRLRALDIVERVGRGEYRAYVEPWWVSGNSQNEPYCEEYDGEISATGLGIGRWDELLLGAAHEFGEATASEESVSLTRHGPLTT